MRKLVAILGGAMMVGVVANGPTVPTLITILSVAALWFMADQIVTGNVGTGY